MRHELGRLTNKEATQIVVLAVIGAASVTYAAGMAAVKVFNGIRRSIQRHRERKEA